MDDCCDLRTGSILATGLLWVLPGIAALLVPRDAMGYAVVRTGMIILIPAAVIFPGSLFSGTRRAHAGLIPGIGPAGIAPGIVHILYPSVQVTVAGDLTGGVMIVFIFSAIVRALVVLASLSAIVIGFRFILSPVSGPEAFFRITGAFLPLSGLIRVGYGIRLPAGQKSCPAGYTPVQPHL